MCSINSSLDYLCRKCFQDDEIEMHHRNVNFSDILKSMPYTAESFSYWTKLICKTDIKVTFFGSRLTYIEGHPDTITWDELRGHVFTLVKWNPKFKENLQLFNDVNFHLDKLSHRADDLVQKRNLLTRLIYLIREIISELFFSERESNSSYDQEKLRETDKLSKGGKQYHYCETEEPEGVLLTESDLRAREVCNVIPELTKKQAKMIYENVVMFLREKTGRMVERVSSGSTYQVKIRGDRLKCIDRVAKEYFKLKQEFPDVVFMIIYKRLILWVDSQNEINIDE